MKLANLNIRTKMNEAEQRPAALQEAKVDEEEDERANCYVCQEGAEKAGFIHGGCACHGTSGFIHLSCLIEAAGHKVESWRTCPSCTLPVKGCRHTELGEQPS